ncbi:UDP-N-acetylglucosamine 1-carboxyvinyltransferase [Candidatus Dojkabacteria bacterium]|nr:UDP-N-acetylglucosamine 1-carboxyvinyltransferase [Candidatus Dojkabacteria bacterium]
MSSYRVVGGKPLKGTISPMGNKNAALPIIAATILTSEKVHLTNVPDISDVRIQINILRKLGASVKYNRKLNELEVKATKLKTTKLDKEDVLKTRGSILFLGPLVGRAGKATLWSTGGCNLGKRPVDSYFQAVERLGAKVEYEDNSFKVDASNLRGSRVWQGEKAVTGTENLIMAAVLAKGKTEIINAASEPHVQDLCNFLNKMGARISGIGSDRLYIEGVEVLFGTEHQISYDFMEVGTFITAAIVTGGELRIENAMKNHLDMILGEFGKFNIKTKWDGETLIVPAKQTLKTCNYLDGSMNKLECLPWPGFPPDLLQFAIVLATQSKGRILIHDKLYEGRLFYTQELNTMGADIFLADPHRLIVNGPTALKGRVLKSPDIRAGMSLLVAALGASGESIIERGEIIERGYSNIEERFRSIGADIERI